MNTFLKLIVILAITICSCKNESNIKNLTLLDVSNEKTTKVKLVAFPSSVEFQDAMLTNMSYKDGRFDFKVTSDLYQLGQQTPDAANKMCANSGKGQHIHLIVDNKPYAAKYTASFDHEVSDGDHTVLAFISRSYHESIKSKGASILKNVKVKDGNIIDESNYESPGIFYSRPKGTYVGKDTKSVMLDYYVANVATDDTGMLLGNYSIDVDINGEKFSVKQWKPHFIEGMPMGENTVTLTLLKDGKPAQVPLKPVTRTFTMKEDPTPSK